MGLYYREKEMPWELKFDSQCYLRLTDNSLAHLFPQELQNQKWISNFEIYCFQNLQFWYYF